MDTLPLCPVNGAENQVLDLDREAGADSNPSPWRGRELTPFQDDGFGNRDAARCIMLREAAATAAPGTINSFTSEASVCPSMWRRGGRKSFEN